MSNEFPLVSVVMPCLNEEKAIGGCIRKIKDNFARNNIDGEIVVCDNGSTDNSAQVAASLGARVVTQPLRGYGNAYLKGFKEARGRYLIMSDSDATYDLNDIPRFLDKLINEGYDFVSGSRYMKGARQIALPFLNRYLGNPLLTFILNLIFGTRYTDVYSGFRAFSRKSYERIKPVSPGMEFNLELAINAKLAGLKIEEIPICLYSREGRSKLRPLRDAWRSLRMMLLYSPNKLFLLPGFFFLLLGIFAHAVALLGLVWYEGRPLGNVTSIFGTIFSVIGFQILTLGLTAKTYSWSNRFERRNKLLVRFYKVFNLEAGIMLGTLLVICGGLILLWLIMAWLKSNLLPLPNPELVSFGATLIMLGFSALFTSLFISAMSIKKRQSHD